MASINKPSLLVLGGTGFIGTNIINKAISRGWQVTSASLSLPSKKKRVKKVEYYKVDLTNFLSVKKKLNKPFSYVINLSGYINHSNLKKNYKKIMKEHFIAVKNVISIIPRKNLKKFIQIGSSAEYGFARAPQSEKSKLSPTTTYSMAKVKTTNFLKKIYKKEKFPFAIARLFLTYGPGQKKDRFIPQIVEGCLGNKKFPTTSAIFLILINKKAIGEVFNVASGVPIKIKNIIYLVKNIVGKGKPEFNKRKIRKDENEVLYADIKKIRKILNWKPKTQLLDGIKKTIKSFK